MGRVTLFSLQSRLLLNVVLIAWLGMAEPGMKKDFLSFYPKIINELFSEDTVVFVDVL